MEIPVAEEKAFDVVILGGSGFTGKYVVREALKFLNNTTTSSPLKSLALAGRNPSKLSQTLKWASYPAHPPPLPIIHADVSDPPSLLSLCRRTKLLLNCVGPFRLYGHPVVSACIEAGTDYLDVCGEPEFMEKMEAIYHGRAAEAGSLVVSACGFDSVPAEMGFIFNSRQWAPSTVPNRVEAYLSLESERRIVGNFGTFESAVLGVANAGQLQELRQSRPRRARPVATEEEEEEGGGRCLRWRASSSIRCLQQHRPVLSALCTAATEAEKKKNNNNEMGSGGDRFLGGDESARMGLEGGFRRGWVRAVGVSGDG